MVYVAIPICLQVLGVFIAWFLGPGLLAVALIGLVLPLDPFVDLCVVCAGEG
jgi:hypothetical protein